MNIKNSLKRSKFLEYLNSVSKSTLMDIEDFYNRKKYARVVDADYTYEEAEVSVRAQIASRGISLALKEKLDIFWVGTDWNQDYSGFIQTLKKRANVYEFRNRNDGYGLESSVIKPDKEVIKRNSEEIYKQISALRNSGVSVDVLLGQMWAHYVDVSVLNELKSFGIVVINISMDDRVPKLWRTVGGKIQGAPGLAHGVDLTLTTSPEFCSWYKYLGCDCIYWPLASSSEVFGPVGPCLDRDIDVLFIGNKYGGRGKLVDSLIKSGIDVHAYGKGWEKGYADPSLSASLYRRAKIVLGSGMVGHSTSIKTLKLRDFDAPMSGALYITHANPDLSLLYEEGLEILMFNDINDAVAKIKHYLIDDGARKKIAKDGCERALKDHNWDSRFNVIYRMIGVH